MATQYSGKYNGHQLAITINFRLQNRGGWLPNVVAPQRRFTLNQFEIKCDIFVYFFSGP